MPQTGPTKTFTPPTGILSLAFQSMQIDEGLVGFGSRADLTILMDMSERDFKDEELKDFLRSQDGNEVMNYQLTVGFYGQNEQTPHAILIIQRSQPEKDQPLFSLMEANPQRNAVLHPSKDCMIIHLHRNEFERPPKTMQLSRSELDQDMTYQRTMDLARVQTTLRVILVTAVKSCPSMYRLVVGDCVTFVRYYVTNLLNYLQALGWMSADENSKHRSDCMKRIRSQEGLIGESEDGSREQGLWSQNAS